MLARTRPLAGARRILMKLDLRDRVSVVVFAYETGLIKPGTSEKPASEDV